MESRIIVVLQGSPRIGGNTDVLASNLSFLCMVNLRFLSSPFYLGAHFLFVEKF